MDPEASARADLATRLGVGEDAITLTSREEVTWRDGSLGCPTPGTNYTQSLVEGYRIVLTVDDRAYRYHGRTGGEPFLCERPSSGGGTVGGDA